MKFKLCALLSAVTFAVTACGGGSGDDNITVNQPTKPVENNEQIIIYKNVSHDDYTINLNSPTLQTGQDDNNKTSLTEIIIDGHHFFFKPNTDDLVTNNNGSQWKYADNELPLIYGADTAYARYGNARLGDNVALFYQGNPTSLDDMKQLEKQADNVTYKGQAFAAREGKYDVRKLVPFVYGVSQFTVNFKDKTLKGSIDKWEANGGEFSDNKPVTNTGIKSVTIDAKIQANTFAGTANKTGTVEGKFYGPNAANLAGSFNDKSQKLRGVFGAVKK